VPELFDAIPHDLARAFAAYERALADDDLVVLDGSFAAGDRTMRGDGAGLLVGHDAISAFRSARGGVAARVIERMEYRPLGEGRALLVSVSRYLSGGSGLQTQVWERIDGRWCITAAHVTARPAALDRSVWRVVGDPLLPPAQDGPLAGTTVAVKDLFAIAGHRIGAGNPEWLRDAPVETRTAPAVADLLRGGAALRGIARTDEFAYSIAGDNPHYGTPANGTVPGALPGGSSSGPASAVATGQADIGLATDTAGSIRVPASYQGLWGLRTTHAHVSTDGLLPLAPSFDAVGWLARDGEVLERVAQCCVGGVSTAVPERLAVPIEVIEAAQPDTRGAFEAFVGELAASGLVDDIPRVSIGELDDYREPFRIVQAAEAWRHHGEWIAAHPGALGPAVAARFEAASTVSASQEASARAALAPLRERMTRLAGETVLIMPTVPGPAPARTAAPVQIDATRRATLGMTTPAAVAGLPSVSAPLLTVPSPLGAAPVGVCLIGPPGGDLALVQLARRLAGLTLDRTETP